MQNAVVNASNDAEMTLTSPASGRPVESHRTQRNGHILIHGVKSLGAECIVFSVLSGVKVMSFKVRG